MDFESIREEILLGRGQENLKLKPKQKEALQAIVFERSRLFKSHCQRKQGRPHGSGSADSFRILAV